MSIQCGKMDDNLERYGLLWQGPETPVSVPMPDGYWTPWHVAQERTERLQRELDTASKHMAGMTERIHILADERDYIRRERDEMRESIEKLQREVAEQKEALRVAGTIIAQAGEANEVVCKKLREAERERDEARTSLRAIVGVVDKACNALTDSIQVSGNDGRTNAHWVSKLRREVAALGDESE